MIRADESNKEADPVAGLGGAMKDEIYLTAFGNHLF